jgi:hypothetical protein
MVDHRTEEAIRVAWEPDHEACAKIKKNFNAWLKHQNSNTPGKNSHFAVDHHAPVIVFPTKTAAILWFEEILGQMSDGYWEDSWASRKGCWEIWHECKVLVKPREPPHHDYVRSGTSRRFGRMHYIPMLVYGVTSLSRDHELAGRMILTCREAGFSHYSFADLQKDLKSIRTAEATKGKYPGE